jgi:sterol desaturase/sphingolipid hydroxylase (fatty acid hydroxylase superfamily)
MWIDVCAFIAGAVVWTFAEYVLHRGLGHRRAKNPFTVEHLRHHANPGYFAPSWKKAIAASSVLGLLAPPLFLAAGTVGLSGAVGFVLMYVVYEIIHRRLHTHPARTRYGEWCRRHHLHHHSRRARMNHGVTSPLWDWVFGTLEVPSRARSR